MEGTTFTMSTLLDTIGQVFSEAISWVGEVVNTITGNPLLLIFAIIGFVGLGVGMTRRLMHV